MNPKNDEKRTSNKADHAGSQIEAAVGLEWICCEIEPDSHRLVNSSSAPIHHPSDQAVQFPVNERPRILAHASFGERLSQERAHAAVKFVLERAHKFLEARTKPGDANRLDAFLPSILIVGCHGENLFQEYLRGEHADASGQFRTAIAAENALAGDHRGERRARDPRQQGGPRVVQQSNGSQRGTLHHARRKGGPLCEGFIFANDAQTRERCKHVNPILARGLTHVGNERFFGFERHTLFQLPTKNRRSEEHTSELQSLAYLVCRLLLEKKKK